MGASSSTIIGDRANHFCQAEIKHLCLAARSDQNVRRFDVAVDEVDFVRRFKRISRLDPDIKQPRERKCSVAVDQAS